MAVKSMDTASRANQTQWGTATGDPFGAEAWAQDRGTANWNITSNEMCCNSASNFNVFILGSQTSGPQEILVRVNPADTTNNHGIIGRYNSSTQYYYFVLVGGNLVIGVAPSFSTIASVSFSYSAGSFYWLRARLLSNNLYAKAWASGSAEPTVWSTNGTDSTYPSGGYGLGSDVPGATNTQFDGFVVTDATIGVASDAVTLSESITQTGVVSLSDSVQVGESVTQTGASSTTDAVTLSENVTQAGAASFTDTVMPSENVTQAGSVQLSEQVNLSESVTQAGTTSITDLVQLSEAVVQTGIVSNTDIVQLSETVVLAALGILNLPADVVQLSESVTLTGMLSLSENVQLNEAIIGAGIIILATDTVQLSEAVTLIAGTVQPPTPIHFTWVTRNMSFVWRTRE